MFTIPQFVIIRWTVVYRVFVIKVCIRNHLLNFAYIFQGEESCVLILFASAEGHKFQTSWCVFFKSIEPLPFRKKIKCKNSFWQYFFSYWKQNASVTSISPTIEMYQKFQPGFSKLKLLIYYPAYSLRITYFWTDEIKV